MSSPDCSFNEKEIPRLEVSFSDQTQEKWAWAKVVDAYLHPEEGILHIAELSQFGVACTVSNSSATLMFLHALNQRARNYE